MTNGGTPLDTRLNSLRMLAPPSSSFDMDSYNVPSERSTLGSSFRLIVTPAGCATFPLFRHLITPEISRNGFSLNVMFIPVISEPD